MSRDVELKREDMDYALSLICQGILSIDDQGYIWRHATMRGKLDAPRRAEAVKSKGYLALTLQMPACCVCGTTDQTLSANGYGHLFCQSCGEAHDRQILARWASFISNLTEFQRLSAIVEKMEADR